MKKLLISALGALFLSGHAMAQVPPGPRSITVSGESKTELAPDQAILSISLVSKDKTIHGAKQHNDALVAKLMTITKQLDIPKEKIATSNVIIAPQYSFEDGEQHFTDYMVSRSLRVTMDNLAVPEKFLSAIVDAKIDQVNGLDYRVADPEARAATLRIEAFANAKAKAEALAQAAGSKLGPALDISTESGGMMPKPPMRPMPMMAAAMHIEPSGAPGLPGTVELRESVMVTFALE